MPSINAQITALKLKKSREQQARDRQEANRKRDALRARIGDNRVPGSVMDTGFVRQLEAKAASAKAGGAGGRVDPQLRIAELRRQGQLPPVEEGPDRPEFATRYSARDALQRMLGKPSEPASRVGYEPTAEEILGDDALPKPKALPVPAQVDEDCPPPDEVLKGGESPQYGAGDLSPEEIAEIDRLNPRRGPVAGVKHARPARRR